MVQEYKKSYLGKARHLFYFCLTFGNAKVRIFFLKFLKLESEYEALMNKHPNNIWILISGVYTNSQPMEKKIDYVTFGCNDMHFNP